MPIKHLESLQPAMAELERALNWVAQDIDDIPYHLVPVIQTKGRKSKCAGWYSPDQWSTREGELVHEITFCAEELNGDPVDIVVVARHEIVHFWCNFLGLKDVSTGGRHNKVFKEYAEILGMDVAKPYDSYGYGYTTPTDELRKRIEKEFQPDVAAFNLFRLVKPSTNKPVKTNAWICDCDKLTLRIPAKQELDATCHKCDTKFIPKDFDAAQWVEDNLPPVEPKKVKKHRHKDGLPEHTEDVPFHEHKEGEGHFIPEPFARDLTPEEDQELTDLMNEVDVALAEPEAERQEMLEAQEETVEVVDHKHTEDFPFHTHGLTVHGNEDVSDNPNLDHDEDAGLTVPGTPVPPKRKRKTKVDELPPVEEE